MTCNDGYERRAGHHGCSPLDLSSGILFATAAKITLVGDESV
jgi:hypothetical protein